jgi:hypothetical protein
MGIHLSTLLKFYKRPEIQKEIYLNGRDREVAVKFEKGFGKRPDTLQYPQDVMEFAKKKASSFHVSEEIWKNPYQITTGMRPKDLNEIRKGWDLVLDIDGIFEFSQIVAKECVELLKRYNISSISCKFSGNKGFHVGVPFKSFPKEVNGTPIEHLFPEAARRVAAFMWYKIEEKVAEEILKKYDTEKLQELTGLSFNELTTYRNGGRKLKVKAIVDIDTVLISSRHLYRSVYSFNEKSGLVSIPINPERIMQFTKIEARPKNVRVSKFRFLDDRETKEGEAKNLFEDAYDWTFDEKAFMEEDLKEMKKAMLGNSAREYDADELAEAIPEEYFPPCIKLILQGIKDGKKRSLFILVNFLTSAGWQYEDIEALLEKWNEKNENMLKEGMIKTHLRYHKVNKKKVLPPNCDNEGYYINIGVCKPDALCSKIKNPLNYAKIKVRRANENAPKERKKKEKKEDKKKNSKEINENKNINKDKKESASIVKHTNNSSEHDKTN